MECLTRLTLYAKVRGTPHPLRKALREFFLAYTVVQHLEQTGYGCHTYCPENCWICQDEFNHRAPTSEWLGRRNRLYCYSWVLNHEGVRL